MERSEEARRTSTGARAKTTAAAPTSTPAAASASATNPRRSPRPRSNSSPSLPSPQVSASPTPALPVEPAESIDRRADSPQPAGCRRVHFPPRLRAVLETNATRDKAEVLLASLLNAQRVADLQQARPVAGTSAGGTRLVSRASMDRAIASTKRLIASLNAALSAAQGDLRDPDLSALDDGDDPASHDGNPTV